MSRGFRPDHYEPGLEGKRWVIHCFGMPPGYMRVEVDDVFSADDLFRLSDQLKDMATLARQQEGGDEDGIS